MPDQKISRALEMQTVALIIGGLILLGATFYAGTKVRYLKAFLASRNKPQLANVDAQKFPGLSSDELVEQALAAERLGNWREAVERLLVAKQRNLGYRDILYHAGKLCYDHGDFNGADRLFERATAFGEQVDTANYMRGLIALGRNDLPAAEQFFEAAINAEPFTPGYYYNLAEALRREHRLKEAINRYEQAGARAGNGPDRTLCQFKARIATAETADVSQLENDIERKRNAGPLSVDWLLTDAALKLRFGQIAEAAQLIQQARSADTNLPNVFASCTLDMLFTDAATKHPEIADACRISGSGSAPSSSPTPFGNH
jgi:tetratricopeptide (TPR) repeat protein